MYLPSFYSPEATEGCDLLKWRVNVEKYSELKIQKPQHSREGKELTG
jgi:hypothetical protein